MPYTRQDILTQNINTYPNNNSGQITPDSVKTFNQNWIDSVVFTDQTGSLVITSASYAQNAGNAQTANSATSATTAVSASFATTASFLTGLVANAVTAQTASYVALAQSASYVQTAVSALRTPNAIITASADLLSPIITFTKGDGTSFNITITQSGSVASASYANNADLLDGLNSTAFVLNSLTSSMSVASASFASTASFALNTPVFNTGSLVTTASFNAYTSSTNAAIVDILLETASINNFSASMLAFTASQRNTNGTFATTASFNAYTASTNTFTSSIQAQVNGLQSATSSYVRNAQTSSMSVLSASFATVASTVQNGLNISASNITVANNLVVNGTASFAYTTTTTGSAVIIGDAFIILNADTPTAPFAGIMVYDTGSASTASFEWNGNGDYWIAVEETGQSAGILTGPLALAKGGETFPASNRLTKGTGTTAITDSNITDTGLEVSINSTTSITGSLGVSGMITGTLSGTASFASNATSASHAQQATSASFASTASFFGGSVVSASYAATASGADTFNVRTSLTASGLRYPTTDGLENQVLKTDGTNDLSFGDVNTLFETVYTGESITKGDPLYISGSQGANPIVYKADAGNAAKMPVIYVASETIAAGNTTRGIVLGLIEGIDLTGYTAGTEIYVAVGGGWTSTRPTGTAIVQILGIVTKGGNGGKGLVLNPGPVELPNLQAGYAWVGDATGVPQAVSTGSINAATAVSASFATTASFALNVPATSSFAISASFANNAGAAQTAVSSSFATNAGTAISASFASTAAAAQTATSASFATNASTAISASFASTAAAAQTATSSSFATTATSASFAATASYVAGGGFDADSIYSYTFLLMGA